ncbi:PSD1 domain-containing protein [Algoriphagus sp. H41]|uniref:PSD1 domain-containing protein n=1 Tax=Algoriphagus oliviformis TaxID=2811231 RepID=A0ABS3C344_9BACT|nr:PSD1 and planctomycete cytochrome C domain-containing protein [Algoriphagus oliviformis]MBN7811543.1 PSD1 domain-containing protein [Algoriphagus oliviformis]
MFYKPQNKSLFRVKALAISASLLVLVSSSALAQSGDEGTGFWLWQLLGRLHPLVVHFPISLLIVAGLLELLTLKDFKHPLRPGIRMLAVTGAVSAVVAAALGLLFASNEGVTGSLLDLHQWIGIISAGLGLALLFFLGKGKKRPKSIPVYRSLLFLSGIGVGVAGHFGASLTHGEDFLTEVLPWQEESEAPESLTIDVAVFASALSPEQEIQLVTNVRSVLAHNCYKCHSGAKIEGELRLDEKEFVFAGGESGPILVPGNPRESELIRRISLGKNHDDVMPSKGKLLSKEEIQLLRLWVEKGAPWPDGVAQQSVYRVAALAPRKPDLPPAKPGLENPIDRWVDRYFQENELAWSETVDDRTYLRRIYLDIIGLLPSPEELTAFESDPNPEKRDIWLQKLLDRKDDFAQHWLTFWNDLLRNDYTGTGYITKGRFAITDWLYTSIRDNKPYEQLVKELLNPSPKSKGFIEGIRWRGTVNASQRVEMQAAQNVGQVILGLNLKCASCHDSFISDWKLEQSYAFANIFADSTLEVSRCETPTGEMAKTKILWEELGEIDSLATKAEKLKQLAEQLVQPANGRMYRTVVNRIWKQLMGRGIVEPVDEMDNQPWSEDLLDWLAVDFVENGYDLKRLIFQIASSKIYQSQSIAVASPEMLMAADFKFQGLVRRRLTAEQFSDAVSQLSAPLFDSAEVKFRPYELIPEAKPSLPFARAAVVANNAFLTSLGRPNREIVSTSRDSQASLLQALELSNGERLNQSLTKGGKNWTESYPDAEQLTRELYARALLRAPNEKELAVAKQAFGERPEPSEVQDFLWAVFLLPEFQMIY